MVECKFKKDLLHLTLNCSVTNLATSSSIYEASLATDDSQPFVKISNGPDAAVSKVTVAERIKGTMTSNCEVVLTFSSLPDSLAEPLSLTLTHTQEKKERKTALSFPLQFKYFVVAAPVVTPDEYNATIMDLLVSGGCVCAPIPLPHKKKSIMFIDDIRSKLRLSTVEVFSDCISLYAGIQGKKSAANSHIAVLLREEKIDGHLHLVVAVKSVYVGLADAVIQVIAQILAEAE